MTKEKTKILCVEDEIDIRENLVEILSDEGYEVHQADNGKSGFEKFIQINPDLVVCDVKMPELDGYSFLRLVRENKNVRNNATPFIFLSALGAKENVIKGIELSANDYLLKPVDFELLMAKIKEKISNVNKVSEKHLRAIDNLKQQVSVVLPNDVFSYLDVITQIAKSLKEEPYGPLPHRGYLNDFSKIYLNSLKIRAVIYNALDHDVIDLRLNAQENIFNCYELVSDFIKTLGDKIRDRIFFNSDYSASIMPKIKCDQLIFNDALRKILSLSLKSASDARVGISVIADHRQQMNVIFYVNSQTQEDIDLFNFIEINELQKIIDQQSLIFQIDETRKNSAILTIPSHRVIALRKEFSEA